MGSLDEALEDFEKTVEKSNDIPEFQKNGYKFVLLAIALLSHAKVEEALLSKNT